jgi:hypothetical protein
MVGEPKSQKEKKKENAKKCGKTYKLAGSGKAVMRIRDVYPGS